MAGGWLTRGTLLVMAGFSTGCSSPDPRAPPPARDAAVAPPERGADGPAADLTSTARDADRLAAGDTPLATEETGQDAADGPPIAHSGPGDATAPGDAPVDCGAGCAGPSCNNTIRDGLESDIDCGGNCPHACRFAAAASPRTAAVVSAIRPATSVSRPAAIACSTATRPTSTAEAPARPAARCTTAAGRPTAPPGCAPSSTTATTAFRCRPAPTACATGRRPTSTVGARSVALARPGAAVWWMPIASTCAPTPAFVADLAKEDPCSTPVLPPDHPGPRSLSLSRCSRRSLRCCWGRPRRRPRRASTPSS